MATQKVALACRVEVGCVTCFRKEPLLPDSFDLRTDGSGFTLDFKMPKGWVLKQEDGNDTVTCGACSAFVKDVPDAPSKAVAAPQKKRAAVG